MPSLLLRARVLVDQALEYAARIEAKNVHVIACSLHKGKIAQETFAENLRYAHNRAVALGKTILIEPLNIYDAPGYHLSTLDEAKAVIKAVGEPNPKITCSSWVKICFNASCIP